jgi:thiol-disulfide isomerase/thioredoxin
MTFPGRRRHFASPLRAAILVAGLFAGTAAAEPAPPYAAPEFTATAAADWLNSPPLTLASLRGQVVLLDVWALECLNCHRSVPWLLDTEKRHAARGLRVIGVHTPEFEHEKDRAAVLRKVKELGLGHPVMLDNDARYWNALGNRYWPTFYLLDRQGRVRGVYIGEMRAARPETRALEEQLVVLLDEQG